MSSAIAQDSVNRDRADGQVGRMLLQSHRFGDQVEGPAGDLDRNANQ